jgi:hypothetical protein
MELLGLVIRGYGMTCFSTANDYSSWGGVQTRLKLHSDAAEDLYRERFEACWGPTCGTDRHGEYLMTCFVSTGERCGERNHCHWWIDHGMSRTIKLSKNRQT